MAAPSTSLPFLRLPFHHVGYTVDSLDRAIDGWSETYGAGPFYVLADMKFDQLEFMGEPFEWEHVSAYGACGGIGVELSTFELPSARPELARRLGGPNQITHVGYLVDDPSAESARLELLGYPKVIYGKSGP